MESERILRGTPATLSVTFYGDETAVDADGAVTATVYDPVGVAYITTTASHQGTGVYEIQLPSQSRVTEYTIVWAALFNGAPTSITTYAEIVGGTYFTLAELRAVDPVLSNTTKYPTAKLVDARASVEADFERFCHRAFVPRYYRETLRGDGTASLWLNRPEPLSVLSLVIDGVDRLADLVPVRDVENLRVLLLEAGRVWPTTITMQTRNIVIEYEYGRSTVPFDIRRAALKLAKYRLVADTARIDERATAMNIQGFGMYTLSTPGIQGAFTGIPEVDVVLDAYNLEGGSG